MDCDAVAVLVTVPEALVVAEDVVLVLSL